MRASKREMLATIKDDGTTIADMASREQWDKDHSTGSKCKA